MNRLTREIGKSIDRDNKRLREASAIIQPWTLEERQENDRAMKQALKDARAELLGGTDND